MAYTQADVDALKLAIAGGAVLQSMTFNETTFTFRTLDEMLTLLAFMQREVNGLSGRRYAATSKGV